MSVYEVTARVEERYDMIWYDLIYDMICNTKQANRIEVQYLIQCYIIYNYNM